MEQEIYRGLIGINIDSSEICSINGGKGELIYCGYNIKELANNASFEEVVYLLWNGELPNSEQLKEFTEALKPHFEINDEIIDVLKAMPKTVHPMHAIRTAVSLLPAFDPDAGNTSVENVRRIGFKLLAKFPTIIAAFARIRKGLEPIKPSLDLNIPANFLYMRSGEIPTEAAVKVMAVALILHAEHSSNASTFTARAAASSLTDVYSAITAALASLKGSLHGGANTAVMQALEKIGDVEGVENYVLKVLSQKGGRVMGFGHRVYRVLDPRADILRVVAEKLAAESKEGKWFKMSLEMERVMDQEMTKRGKQVKPNVDFFSASVYRMLGFPPEMYTPLFAVARVSGWVAHLIEQYANNRLMRPRLVYKGPRDKTFKPIDQR